jgi:hypothetical protein
MIRSTSNSIQNVITTYCCFSRRMLFRSSNVSLAPLARPYLCTYIVNVKISNFLYFGKRWGIVLPAPISWKTRCLDRQFFLRLQFVPYTEDSLHYNDQWHKYTYKVYCYFCPILPKIQVSRNILVKNPTKICPMGVAWLYAEKPTDGHTWQGQ